MRTMAAVSFLSPALYIFSVQLSGLSALTFIHHLKTIVLQVHIAAALSHFHLHRFLWGFFPERSPMDTDKNTKYCTFFFF